MGEERKKLFRFGGGGHAFFNLEFLIKYHVPKPSDVFPVVVVVVVVG